MHFHLFRVFFNTMIHYLKTIQTAAAVRLAKLYLCGGGR